jgi:uncharacterized protein (DUF2461 family)
VRSSESTFSGFRPEAIQFLADLAANNDRAWFQPRKAEYERLLKEPMEAEVESPELPDRLADAYQVAVPVFAFLASLG